MVDYKKMYLILCGAASDALDMLPHDEKNKTAITLLEQGLANAEELYIATAGNAEHEGQVGV